MQSVQLVNSPRTWNRQLVQIVHKVTVKMSSVPPRVTVARQEGFPTRKAPAAARYVRLVCTAMKLPCLNVPPARQDCLPHKKGNRNVQIVSPVNSQATKDLLRAIFVQVESTKQHRDNKTA